MCSLPRGDASGERIAAAVGARLASPTAPAFASSLKQSFAAGEAIIGVCASGILIRILAPLLSDKTAEPPVLAVSEDGSAVVPLLGGHRGANELASQVAALTGGSAAVTTASDTRFGSAMDAPRGYTLANPANLKAVLARLLSGDRVRIEGEAPFLAGLPAAADAPVGIRVTDRAVTGDQDVLVYHPHVLAVGVGCERGARPDDMVTFVRSRLAAEGLAPEAVACVVSLDLKADEPAVGALAGALGVPARFFTAAELDAEASRLKNPSEQVRREVGCPGVAEGAALRAAGRQSELIVEKCVGPRLTCAIARADAADRSYGGRSRTWPSFRRRYRAWR